MLLRIKETADTYHRRIALEHGSLFTVTGTIPPDCDSTQLLRAKSVKTGEIVSMYEDIITFADPTNITQRRRNFELTGGANNGNINRQTTGTRSDDEDGAP
jgi:hypothetical protein